VPATSDRVIVDNKGLAMFGPLIPGAFVARTGALLARAGSSSSSFELALTERVTGIEPALPAWKAGTLPLSYTREVGLVHRSGLQV
jgi:hypothetical protein